MKTKIGFSAVLIILGLCLTVLNNTVLSASDDTDKGKQIYEQNCLACHGPEGKGDGPLAMTLKPAPANLGGKTVKSKPDSDLLTVIRKGKDGTSMPPWEEKLSEQEINDVLAYVRALTK